MPYILKRKNSTNPPSLIPFLLFLVVPPQLATVPPPHVIDAPAIPSCRLLLAPPHNSQYTRLWQLVLCSPYHYKNTTTTNSTYFSSLSLFHPCKPSHLPLIDFFSCFSWDFYQVYESYDDFVLFLSFIYWILLRVRVGFMNWIYLWIKV